MPRTTETSVRKARGTPRAAALTLAAVLTMAAAVRAQQGAEDEFARLAHEATAGRYSSDRARARAALRRLAPARRDAAARLAAEGGARQRLLGVQLLAELNDPRDVPVLARRLSDEDPWVRISAGAALAERGSLGQQALQRALDDPAYPYADDLEQVIEVAVTKAIETRFRNGGKQGFYANQFIGATRFGRASVRVLERLLTGELPLGGDYPEAAADALGDMTDRPEAGAALQRVFARFEEEGRADTSLHHALICALHQHGVREPAETVLARLHQQGDHNRVAILAIRTGRYRLALEAYRRLIEGGADNAIYYYNSACALSLAGKVEAAVEYLERAAAHGYSDLDWLRQDGDLNPLRTEPVFKEFLARFEAAVAKGAATTAFTEYQRRPMAPLDDLFGPAAPDEALTPAPADEAVPAAEE